MKYFSMFSGIGGFELGIIRAINIEHALVGAEPEPQERTQGRERATDKQQVQLHPGDGPTALCVGYSEIDKYASMVYERHFNGHRNYGDATRIDERTLPDFDLLVGGFPCQAFSIAGKRKGFNEARGTLFFDIARILYHKRPRHLVLENVKGLLTHDSGKTFQTILRILTGMGYGVEWQVLNSKDFGVPQNRERVYIVGHLGNRCAGKVFPIAKYGGKATYGTLHGSYHKGQHTGSYVEASLSSLSDRQDLRQEKAKSHTNEQRGGAETTPRIRRLTPKECERLQGFPDDWTNWGKAVLNNNPDPVNIEQMSDTQRYKMCGNAVTVNVVEAVISNLIKCMKEEQHAGQ